MPLFHADVFGHLPLDNFSLAQTSQLSRRLAISDYATASVQCLAHPENRHSGRHRLYSSYAKKKFGLKSLPDFRMANPRDGNQ
ncbi:hypothetical protein [Methylomonas rosea]|uniref:Uncharacterized protein n=1 Tax=Methylomonas rosea TaxID=2952227 RepID=A0ABT1TR98_9GAMM|nr:hypothetical protein [Methylomonas sp. WSC-7]MCQ8117299.1 hypothetical protein [Methylomonas sp. WSC-7]